MSKIPVLWVLVADGGRVRVLIPDATEGQFRSVLPPGLGAGAHSRPLMSDAGDDHGFAADLGEQLNQEAARGAFDRLVLVGPGHVLHDLQMRLNKRAGGRVIGTVMNDDTDLNDRDLSLHLARWWQASAGVA